MTVYYPKMESFRAETCAMRIHKTWKEGKYLLYKILLACSLNFVVFSKEVHAEQKASDALIVNDPEWPPFFFAGKKASMPGFGKDVLSLCLDQMEKPYEFSFFPIERMKYGLREGLVDINIYSINPEREEFLHFGKEALFELAYYPVVRADSDIKIKSLSDFDKYRLGHQLGFFYSEDFHKYVENRRKQGTLDETHSNMSNFQKLLANRIDVFVTTSASSRSVSKSMGITGKIKTLDFEISRSKYFIALSKKSPRVADPQKFLKRMDDCLRRLKATGKYCQMAAPYEASCS